MGILLKVFNMQRLRGWLKFGKVTGMEIMTVDEVAAWLRMSKRSVYELTSARGRAKMKHPLPVLRIGSSVRFRKSDIEAWVEKLVAGAK